MISPSTQSQDDMRYLRGEEKQLTFLMINVLVLQTSFGIGRRILMNGCHEDDTKDQM